MADISQTPTSVTPGAGAVKSNGSDVFGETVAAGMPIYQSASDQKIYKAVVTNTSAKATVVGVALNGGAVNQPAVYQSSGVINIGGTVVVGAPYYASPTNAGGVAPYADLNTNHYVTILGHADTNTSIQLGIKATGVQHA